LSLRRQKSISWPNQVMMGNLVHAVAAAFVILCWARMPAAQAEHVRQTQSPRASSFTSAQLAGPICDEAFSADRQAIHKHFQFTLLELNP